MTSLHGTIAITNVDSLVGYALAYQFCQEMQRKNEAGLVNVSVRVLCRQKTGMEALEHMGATIIEIDYLEPLALCHALGGVQYLVFIPEHSHQRLHEGETLLRIASQQRIDYVAMVSLIGVDQLSKTSWRHMCEYRELEEQIQSNFGSENHCIFRIPMLSQGFFYLTPMVEDRGALGLTVPAHQSFGVIDLKDVVRAILCLSMKKHHGQNRSVFEFTPSGPCLSGQDMADLMADGLEKDELGYEQVDSNTLARYLNGVRHDYRFRERPRFGEPGQHLELFPLGRYLNDTAIDTWLEWFMLAKEGKADVVTDDLENAIGHPPTSLHDFFKSNRENFRRLR